MDYKIQKTKPKGSY